MILDNIVQALKYIAECYKMVVEEPKLLLPSLASVIVGSFIGIFVIGFTIAFDIIGRFSLYLFGFFVLTALFISYLTSYMFMGISSFAVYEHVKYGRSSLGKAVNVTMSRAGTVMLLAAVAVVIGLLAKNLKNKSHSRGGIVIGMIGSLVGEVLEEGWSIASRLLVPIAVISGLGFTDTFRKAFDIVTRNLVLIGAGEVGLRILTGAFGFVCTFLTIAAAVGLFIVLSPLNIIAAIAAAVFFAFTAISVVSTLNLFVKTSYYTLVYAWAEDRIEHGSTYTIQAPAPLRNAFGM